MADNARNGNNAPPHPPHRAVAPSRQPKREISFWLIELNREHLSEGALVRTTRVMEASLCQEAEDDAARWSNDNSGDHDYPGARRINIGQLWDEHHTFLDTLPIYLEYGGV